MSDVKFIDFALVKERASIHQVMQILDLKLRQTGGQFRGSCPVHGGGDRTLVVTPGKGFFWFVPKQGGDQIALCSHARQIGNQQAADQIAKHYGIVQVPEAKGTGNVPRNGSPAPAAKGLQALAYLEAESVQALGVSAETAKLFESGYAGKGVLRGRYAVPVKNRDGSLAAYVGIAVNPVQSPALLFHNFEPSGILVNSDVAAAGHLTICRDPLSLIQAVENGVPREELVSFLAPITALSLQVLASFLDEIGADTCDLF